MFSVRINIFHFFILLAKVCETECNPCRGLQNDEPVSQLDAKNIAQQLVAIRSLLLKAVDRIPTNDENVVSGNRS